MSNYATNLINELKQAGLRIAASDEPGHWYRTIGGENVWAVRL
jgi:predicted secreted protein